MAEYYKKWGITSDRYYCIERELEKRLDKKYNKLLMISREKLVSDMREILHDILQQKEKLIKIYNDDPLAHLPEKPVEPPKCQHKWRDYDWYMEYTFDRNPGLNCWILSYKIFEPYVCTLCHDRNNVRLEEGRTSVASKDDLAMALSKIMSLYPKIKARAIVEDEINDDIHVDREYLKWADFLAGRREAPGGKDIQLKLEYERSGADAVERKEGGEETA